jgi:hypothetical protein
MTKFIDKSILNTDIEYINRTKFEKWVTLEKGLEDAKADTLDYEIIELIGKTLHFSIFIAYKGKSRAVLYIGTKGDEFKGYKNQVGNTLFIDKTFEQKDREIKKTVFNKCVNPRKAISNAVLQPNNYDIVEFLKHDKSYGDVFYAYDIGHENDGTLYFGNKGDEFDNQ